MLTASRKWVSLSVLEFVEPYRSLFVGSVELRSSVHSLSMRIGIGSALLLFPYINNCLFCETRNDSPSPETVQQIHM